eukprot:UN07789
MSLTKKTFHINATTRKFDDFLKEQKLIFFRSEFFFCFSRSISKGTSKTQTS